MKLTNATRRPLSLKFNDSLTTDNLGRCRKCKNFIMFGLTATPQLVSSESVDCPRTCQKRLEKFIVLSWFGRQTSTTWIQSFARFYIFYISMLIFRLNDFKAATRQYYKASKTVKYYKASQICLTV